jgi:hypothetical protein
VWAGPARRAAEAQWAQDVGVVRQTAAECRCAATIVVFAEQRLYGRLDQWTDVFARVMRSVAEDVAARVARGSPAGLPDRRRGVPGRPRPSAVLSCRPRCRRWRAIGRRAP